MGQKPVNIERLSGGRFVLKAHPPLPARHSTNFSLKLARRRDLPQRPAGPGH